MVPAENLIFVTWSPVSVPVSQQPTGPHRIVLIYAASSKFSGPTRLNQTANRIESTWSKKIVMTLGITQTGDQQVAMNDADLTG